MLCHAESVKGEAASGSNREGESTDAERRGGAARSSEEGPVMGLERRGCVVRPWPLANWKREEPVDEAKPFKIPKREVWEAFKHVKANQGAAGVDGQSIAKFEANLSGNLYKLWNRLSSGSYFPPPVRRVDIPKANGGTRPLGIPTVADRIAQEVADATWSRSWSRCSTPTPMATGPANPRSMQCTKLVSAAGATTGCSISTSRASWMMLHTTPQLVQFDRRGRIESG